MPLTLSLALGGGSKVSFDETTGDPVKVTNSHLVSSIEFTVFWTAYWSGKCGILADQKRSLFRWKYFNHD